MSQNPSQESQGTDSHQSSSLPVPIDVGHKSIPQPETAAGTIPFAGQPSPTTSSGAPSQPEFRAKFAEEIHQYIREYIRLADQKATFLFTGATALLAFLYGHDVSKRWLRPVMSWNMLDLAAFVAMTFLAVGAFMALLVVIPRMSGSKRGFVFWDAIPEYGSSRAYADELASLTAPSLFQAKAEHCFDLARVCRSKYRSLRLAFYVAALGLLASLVVFVFALS